VYRSILPIVLYGYEAWSLTLREEHRLKLLGNRVLRRKREEVEGSLEKTEDLGVDGRIILEWILRKYVGRCGLCSSGSG
jgi:hypothetical protein